MAATSARSSASTFTVGRGGGCRTGQDRRAGAVTVLVSHRFSTHDELMAAGGVYAGLYSVQAQAYG